MTPLAFVVACSLGFHDFVPIRTDHEGVALPREVVGRVGSMRFRHAGTIHHVVVTPNERYCVTQSGDHTISVWELQTGRRVEQSFFFDSECHAIAADDTHITFVVSEKQGTYCRRLELLTGRVVLNRKLEHDVDKAALSKTGDRVVLRLGAVFEVQDSTTGKVLHRQRFSISDFAPHQMILAPNGRSVAARFQDWIEVIDVETGNTLLAESVARKEQDRCSGIEYTSDSTQILRCMHNETRSWIDSATLGSRGFKTITSLHGFANWYCAVSRPDDPNEFWAITTHRLERYQVSGKRLGTYRLPFACDGSTTCSITINAATVLVQFGNAMYVFDRMNQCWLTLHSEPYNMDVTCRLNPDGDTVHLINDSFLLNKSHYSRWNWATSRLDDSLPFAWKTVQGWQGRYWWFCSPDMRFVATQSRSRISMYSWPSGELVEQLTFARDAWPAIVGYHVGHYRLVIVTLEELILYPHDRARPIERLRHPAIVSSVPHCQISHDELAILQSRTNKEPCRIHTYSFITQNWSVCEIPANSRESCYQHFPSRYGNLYTLVYPTHVAALDPRSQRMVLGPIHCPQMNSTAPLTRSTTDARSLIVANNSDSLLVLEAASLRLRHQFRSFHGDDFGQLSIDRQGHYFATHSHGHAVQIWDFRGRHAGYPTTLTLAELERLWTQLLQHDAEASFQALRRLAAAPTSTIPFVRERVAPAKPSPKLNDWLRDLDSPSFAEREAAARELMRLADIHQPELRDTRRTTTSADLRTRLDRILASAEYGSPTMIRRERIVELADWCDTPDAVALLKSWANGSANAGLTLAARTTLADRRP
jgi:hypothetical protein